MRNLPHLGGAAAVKLTRAERRAIRFLDEQYPHLYNAIFGEVMALTNDDNRWQGLHAVAEICREAGQAIICAITEEDKRNGHARR